MLGRSTDQPATIAKDAYILREVALEKKVMSDQELNETLDPMSMTEPG